MKKVLILGNGKSRLKYLNFIQQWKDEIWVCNTAYEEHTLLPRVNVVGTVHPEIGEKAYKYSIKNSINYTIFSSKIRDKYKGKIIEFDHYRGWLTGNELLHQALIRNYDEIVILGFDSNGQDIYHPTPLVTTNIQNQLQQICKEFKMNSVKVIGEKTHFHNINDFPKNNYIKYPDTYFKEPKKLKNVLILHNSNVYKNFSIQNQIDNFIGDIWLCNDINKDINFNFNLVFSVHNNRVFDLNEKRRELNKDFEIVVPKVPDNQLKKKLYIQEPINYRGFTTGAEAINEAFMRNYDKIYIAGFGFKEYNKVDKNIDDNFKKQLIKIVKENGNDTIVSIDNNEINKNLLKVKPIQTNRIIQNLKKDMNINKIAKTLKESKYVRGFIKEKINNYNETDNLKFLILGNDKTIRLPDWKKIKKICEEKNIIIAGVNRIYKAIDPDILFFIDDGIATLLQKEKIKINNMLLMSTDYLHQNNKISKDDKWVKKNNVQIFPNPRHHINRTNSVLWLLILLNWYIFYNKNCTFYTYGTAINPNYWGYFWLDDSKQDPNKINPKQIETCKFHIDLQFQGWQKLQNYGFNIISFTPNSKLKLLFKHYEDDLEKLLKEI